MRRITRGPAPPCLGNYKHGAQNWGHVTPADKDTLNGALATQQRSLCAYCEGSLDAHGRHIDHFLKKGAHPKLTFSWSNLYASCARRDSCGHYKDNGAGSYQVTDLIDPCSDDPDRFLRFRQDGRVEARAGLGARDTHRATETIRVFHLDIQGHHAGRRDAMNTFNGKEPDVLSALVDFEPDVRRELIDEFVAATEHEPYSAVVRQLFEDIP